MITGARLVALDGVTELLVFDDPVRLQALSLGYPEARASVNVLPGRSGEQDITRYHGGAAVTLDLAVQDNDVVGRDVLLDRIRAYCAPGRRAWLHITSSDWPAERRILVRGDSAPLQLTAPGVQKVSVGMRAPAGVYESTVLNTVTLFPSAGAEGGLTYPIITYPITYAAGNVTGGAVVANAGTVDAFPFADIYGFCRDPALLNLTTGQRLGFTGLTIQAGDFLRVDMGEQTALLSNDATLSRYSLLDFTTSSWWALESDLDQPAGNQVALVVQNPSSTCQAFLNWRDTTI